MPIPGYLRFCGIFEQPLRMEPIRIGGPPRMTGILPKPISEASNLGPLARVCGHHEINEDISLPPVCELRVAKPAYSFVQVRALRDRRYTLHPLGLEAQMGECVFVIIT